MIVKRAAQDADEVTYNLHLELKLLEGELRVKDLPEAWHAAMQADLGIAPSDDRNGCLQDAHARPCFLRAWQRQPKRGKRRWGTS